MSQVKTFGRYNLIRKVAQGGMAEIFLAKFQGIGGFEKKIIIKRILPRFSENREFIDMLIKEAKTAVLLHHQNIVQIYDLGKVRDTYFISMEYIRGKDLRTVLNRLKSQGQLMPRELAVYIAREICKGLDYAHNITDQHGQPLNLVHRDISPPNILLSLEGEVKIIDFGIAKATSQATDTQAGVFKGKFAYMAPEQASAQPVDRRSDIFATTLILWEMLTTRKLLEAETDIMTLERAKRIDSYEVPYKEYQTPEQLENIIRKGLRQERPTRYQTAGEMARDLTIFLNLNYPGFSETDLADFLRTLFNLDKRRGSTGGDAITPAPGDRSNTSSEFFKPLLQTGEDSTDPSIKVRESAAAQRPTSQSQPLPRREGAGGNDQWDLLEEIKAFAKAGEEGAQGEGWESQVAADIVHQEDGTIITIPQEPGQEGVSTQVRQEMRSGTQPGVTTSATTGVGSAAQPFPPPPSLASRVAVPALLLAIVFIVMGALFPERVQQLKERFGLIPKATIAFAYDPADADVVLDGAKLADATSPYTLTLQIGARHALEVKREGFLPERVDIDLVGNRTHPAINVRLKPALATGKGKLELVGLPEGARTLINGAPVTASALNALPTETSLTVRVEKDFYEPFEKTIAPLGDQPLKLEVTMKAALVPVKVVTDPLGAIIMIDGRQVGTAPYEGTFAPGQAYELSVLSAGYKSYSDTLKPEIGRGLQVNVKLESAAKAGGSSSATQKQTNAGASNTQANTGTTTAPVVNTTPAPQANPDPPPTEPKVSAVSKDQVKVRIVVVPWAEVYIDGKYQGRTPLQDIILTPGRHRLRLVNKEKDLDYAHDYDFKPSDDGAVQTLRFEM